MNDISADKNKKCAPDKIFTDGSCISLDVLVEMANAYNIDNPTNQIVLYTSFETLNRDKYRKYLIAEFSKRLASVCSDQLCWTRQGFVKKMQDRMRDELTRHTFRPVGPEGQFQWLNTLNINDTMRQYEAKYPDFKFLGAVPIDFDDLPQLGIRDLNLQDLVQSGKTKLGIVFNLDESYKSGSHWVSAFANLQDGHVYYFDSYGFPPDERIRKFMRRLANFCKNDLKVANVVATHNKTRHQFGGSECGVYSINFILRLLRGDTFETICSVPVPDNAVNVCRKVYFT